MDADRPPRILMTGFEPSGDDHASAVIAELRSRRPDVEIFAWGGKKMEAAGASIIEYTGRDAVMGIPGLKKIREHRAINRRIGAWLDENPVDLHIPVDSPAANFPVCAMAKARGIRVVHLVAPQVWAWGAWRVNKLRRLTNHVLCLLPFEETWFRERRVPSTFVGHPLFDEPLETVALDETIASWPEAWRSAPLRLALLPGSRPAELRKNFPLLVEAYRRLEREHPGLRGIVAATGPETEATLRALARDWPGSLMFKAAATDEVVRWCELALAVSGTVTLQVARQRKPMVIVYKSSRLLYALLVRWVLTTTRFSLPNLIAGKEIVPELVPHFGGAGPIVDKAVTLLERPELMEAQRQALGRVAESFQGTHAARGAAGVIDSLLPALRDTPGSSPEPEAEPIASADPTPFG